MIPVQSRPAPPDFDSRVAEPGRAFLARHPRPTATQWKAHAYWQRALGDLCTAYDYVCAYTCQRLERTTGARSVDHFKPKDTYPELAYNWPNYRLACGRLNSRKRNREILDPFTLAADSFEIVFPSLEVRPGPRCREDAVLRHQVEQTCLELRLNDEETCIASRYRLVVDYCAGHISFEHLEREHLFLGYEMRRQGLVELERVREVMSWDTRRG